MTEAISRKLGKNNIFVLFHLLPNSFYGAIKKRFFLQRKHTLQLKHGPEKIFQWIFLNRNGERGEEIPPLARWKQNLLQY